MKSWFYQTMGDPPPTWPYGVFIVPIEGISEIVVERNTQGLIGGPPIWREWHRWKNDR